MVGRDMQYLLPERGGISPECRECGENKKNVVKDETVPADRKNDLRAVFLPTTTLPLT